MNEQNRQALIVHLGITEVTQMELQDNLISFFARVPEMAEVQKYEDRMTLAQARDIWHAFEDLVG